MAGFLALDRRGEVQVGCTATAVDKWVVFLLVCVKRVGLEQVVGIPRGGECLLRVPAHRFAVIGAISIFHIRGII